MRSKCGCCLKQNESDVESGGFKDVFVPKNSRHVYVNINLTGTEDTFGALTEILQEQSVKCYLHHIFEYLHKVVGKEEKMFIPLIPVRKKYGLVKQKKKNFQILLPLLVILLNIKKLT